ncbi:MAG: relaxase/mobilization nuclease domain-containing protein, partial [Lachnospiraceae bacterium]|nr:relaxase/mobilization nuclease domain-containing protein [Lachnospiraceae bacterium]
ASEGIRSTHLKNALLYIVNEEKTKKNAWVGGVNCLPLAEAAYEQMMQTKQYFGKELGRQGYHIIISFEKGECRPDMAFQIGAEFVERYLGEDYECVYAVHDDKEHCHIHIIFNSINLTDGKKYHYNKGDWKHIMQPITNDLCKKYGLGILPAEYSREKSNVSRDEWNHDKSYNHYILDNAWYCLSVAEDEEHFVWLMEQLGYTIKMGVHLAVWMPGMKRYKRLDTLDKAFARENIPASIQKAHDEDIRMEEITIDPGPYYHYGIYGYQETYYGYLVRMRKVEMDRFNYKMARFYKDCMLVEKIQQRYSFLVDNEIHSAEDIFAKKFAMQREIEEISKRQKEIYRDNSLAKKRCKSPDDIPEYQRILLKNEKELAGLKKRKRKLGRELRVAQEILDEKGLSAFEVLLEEGWKYKDYSKVPDRPEPPAYPYRKKDLVERENESIYHLAENTEEKPVVTETDFRKMPSDESSSDLFISTFIDDQKEKASMLTNGMSESSKEIAAVDETEDMKEETHYFSDYYGTGWLDQAAISNADESVKEQEESLQNEQEKIVFLPDAVQYDRYKDIKKAGHGGEGKDEPKESGGLPARYSEFMKLSYAEKAERLCKPGEDADNILYLLQEYAQSVGHKFPYFDELMEEAERIREAFDERNVTGETEKIVDRLVSSGITARNFMSTDSRKISACFDLPEVSLNEVSKQFNEVVRRIGVRAEQQELFQKFMEVYDRISKTADRTKELDKQEKRWGRDSRGR